MKLPINRIMNQAAKGEPRQGRELRIKEKFAIIHDSLFSIQPSKAFTLIELLVVIAIVGILSAITIVSVKGVQTRARDTQRKSDLNQYRIALENYANANSGKYPVDNSQIWELNSSLGDVGGQFFATTGAIIDEYMASQLRPPTNGAGSARYLYFVDTNRTNYVLMATMELYDEYGSAKAVWQICSDGRSGLVCIDQPTNPSCVNFSWGSTTCNVIQ